MEHNPTTTEALDVVNPSVANTMIADFANNAPSFYCSFVPNSDQDKRVLYNAMNGADVQLADHIGQTIVMRDIIVEPVEITKEETGETVTAPRCIIIDVDGNSYTCVSTGIYNALRRLCTIFGRPTWQNGLPVKVRQLTRGARRLYTLDATI